MSRTQSSIGAAQYYGPRSSQTGLPSGIAQDGPTEVVEIAFDYEQANSGLPTVNANVDVGVLTIPANAYIKSATLFVGTAFTSAGSATLDIGTEQTDGTTVDADGLDTIAVASLTANSVHVLDGAQVGASVGSNEAQVTIDDATAAFTAGTGRLVVEYVASRA